MQVATTVKPDERRESAHSRAGVLRGGRACMAWANAVMEW